MLAVDLGNADMSIGIKSDKSINVFHCMNKLSWTCIMWNMKSRKAVYALITMPRDIVGTNHILLQRNVISSCFDLTGSCPVTMPSTAVNLLFTKLFKGLKCNVYTDIQTYTCDRERERENCFIWLEKIEPYFIICFLFFISSYFFLLMAEVKSQEDILYIY